MRAGGAPQPITAILCENRLMYIFQKAFRLSINHVSWLVFFLFSCKSVSLRKDICLMKSQEKHRRSWCERETQHLNCGRCLAPAGQKQLRPDAVRLGEAMEGRPRMRGRTWPRCPLPSWPVPKTAPNMSAEQPREKLRALKASTGGAHLERRLCQGDGGGGDGTLSLSSDFCCPRG